MVSAFAQGYGGQARLRGRMNTLILNRETFQMPEDGWYQMAPLGEFPHLASGVVQVVDAAACVSMVNRFNEESQAENFAGLLIDFDHFSLDRGNKSEAAGWIVALEFRAPRDEGGNLKPEVGNGLWAKIRWSDLGEDAVKGGRYRFLSPVWTRADCEELGNDRVRPVRLLNAAVTNDPNLKGMVPLSNRQQTADHRPQTDGDGSRGAAGGADATRLANADDEQRYRWTLGKSPDGRHCPSCAALTGQVHTMDEWNDAGLTPGSAALYCGGHCHCNLVATNDPVSGDLDSTPSSDPDDVENRDAGVWLTWARWALRNRGESDERTREAGSPGAVLAAEKRRLRAAKCSDR